MSYSPGYNFPIFPMVSVFTAPLGWVTENVASSVPASTAWEATDRTVYVPLRIPASCVVRRVWWANGATTTGGATVGVGVYADTGGYQPGTKLVSGSATQGTASQVQFVDVTDTTLAPGLYWIAITASTTTNTTIFRTALGATTSSDAAYRFEESSVLPTTATPVESTATNVWLCGFATTASP